MRSNLQTKRFSYIRMTQSKDSVVALESLNLALVAPNQAVDLLRQAQMRKLEQIQRCLELLWGEVEVVVLHRHLQDRLNKMCPLSISSTTIEA